MDSGSKMLKEKEYQASEMESEADHDLEFYDKIQTIRGNNEQLNNPATGNINSNFEFVNLNQQIEFRDFLEPNVIKTGHIIPSSAGHNGHLSVTELTLYEIHLNNAGFLHNYQTEEQILEYQNTIMQDKPQQDEDYGMEGAPSNDNDGEVNPMALELEIDDEENNANFQLDIDQQIASWAQK